MGCVLSPGTNLSYPPIVSHLISSSSDDILQMRPEGSNLSVIWLLERQMVNDHHGNPKIKAEIILCLVGN